MCGCLSHGPSLASTGDLARNPGMCPDWELNRQPFGLQPTFNPLSYTSQGLFLYKKLYFKTMAPMMWGLANPKSAGQTRRLKSQAAVDPVVLRQNFFYGNLSFCYEGL